ncbi:MAG: hypothetical protein Q9227_009202 [Pyrenula ochraceoflavens]
MSASSSAIAFPVALKTALSLIDQFSASLSQPHNDPTPYSTNSSPPPLPLLSASAISLKAQVTKLSLLAITSPFTPSAISTILSALNDSVLPSLMTAALSITEDSHTATYQNEVIRLARATLRDLGSLIELAGRRKGDCTEEEKPSVTEATGKVWEDCDELVTLVDTGAEGFILKKAGEFLELVQDAVKELEEWDPDLDDDDFEGSDSEHAEDDDLGRDERSDNGNLLAQKDSAVKVLKKVPICMHVVLKNRLHKKTGETVSEGRAQFLDKALGKFRRISETVDEAVGTLQEGDTTSCASNTKSAQEMTLDLLESMLKSKETGRTGSGIDVNGLDREDKYVMKARDFMEAVSIDVGHANGITKQHPLQPEDKR